MKVIDLLNKIANGEEVPRKIKVYDREYEFDAYNSYRNKEMLGTLGQHYSLDGMLNDEVEIIEDTPKENKKIEKLNIGTIVDDELQGLVKSINICNKEIQDKLDELIDKVNGE